MARAVYRRLSFTCRSDGISPHISDPNIPARQKSPAIIKVYLYPCMNADIKTEPAPGSAEVQRFCSEVCPVTEG